MRSVRQEGSKGEVKNFDHPDETRTFDDRDWFDIVAVRGQQVGRAVFEPGWRWSESVRLIAGTDSCQVEHLVYVVAAGWRCPTTTAAPKRATPATWPT